MGKGSAAGPWVGETILSSAERREFEERRAAVEARASDLAERVGACANLQSLVRGGLASLQHVRAVEAGPVLLTSHPPRMPIAFAVALGSGRVVWDRLAVTVPVRPKVVPLGRAPGDPAAPPCDLRGR